MGKADAFQIEGLDLWFNSSDHKPPHFHVEKASAWEVRVYFMRGPSEMIDVKCGTEPSGRDRRSMTKLAEAHRIELLIEWETKVSVKTPGAEK